MRRRIVFGRASCMRFVSVSRSPVGIASIFNIESRSVGCSGPYERRIVLIFSPNSAREDSIPWRLQHETQSSQNARKSSLGSLQRLVLTVAEFYFTWDVGSRSRVSSRLSLLLRREMLVKLRSTLPSHVDTGMQRYPQHQHLHQQPNAVQVS
ncbi:hypothetical protein P154DRAFT_49782 [Amniculicola lignicola CBS 123094]|uniref:Uncharacterized protein n=1 Tax=Amniculicola lignicola CBS 123094 TaxID=1392246 RepID=A0A6A5VYT1_9PLEO|nr:hypothetical protein P154DRAFT_49782 [Amniculicola lignicola CBS 123094]